MTSPFRVALRRCGTAAAQAAAELMSLGRPSWRATPNPLAREIVLPPGSVPLLSQQDLVLRFQKRPLDLPAVSEASKFVASIVSVDAVSEVLLKADRVTINVEDDASWNAVVPEISKLVSEAARCGSLPDAAVARLSELAGTVEVPGGWAEGSVEAEIAEVLELHVRPHVREDGGDVRFVRFDATSGVAKVQLVGACSGCPSSAATLHGRVATLLKHFVPEVESVAALSDAEAAAEAAVAGEAKADGVGSEKVSLEEHMRRLLEEGAATSIEWDAAHQRPLGSAA